MPYLQKLGAIAAFINVLVLLATSYTAFVLIGFPAIADPNQLIELAMRNPT